jgi:hypothetical protein
MMRARVLVGAVAFLVVVAAGCGVRSQSSPTAIEPDDIPFGLLEPEAGTADPDTGGFAAADVTIYLMGSNGLLPVEREVTRPAGARKVLQALMEGPTPGESALGLQSALDPDAAPPAIEHDGRRILVELHEGFFTEGGAQIAALAQIVYTLTDLVPRARVQFLVEGEPVEVPRGDGVLTSRLVDRDDYIQQAPPPL